MFHKFALEDLNCLYLYLASPDHNYNHNVFNNPNYKLATSYSEPRQ
jgi:hypothetical protein